MLRSRSACVCSRWNRLCDTKSLWEILGVHRWSLCLEMSLNNGFSLPLQIKMKKKKTSPKLIQG